MLKRLFPVLALGVVMSGALQADETVKTALITEGFYTVSGTFGSYDFSDAETAFDWAFTTADGASYQLQGKSPNDNDVFGWKAVDITTPDPAWYMFALGADVDGDGGQKFDWVLLSTDLGHKAAYKLAGVSGSGTFEYSDKLSIDYDVTGSNITMFEPLEPFSMEVYYSDTNIKQVVFDYDGGINITKATYYDASGNPTYIATYEYSAGRIHKVNSDYDADGIADAAEVNTFDAQHRIIASYDGNGNKLTDVSYAFYGNGFVSQKTVQYTDGKKEEITFEYDAYNRLSKTVSNWYDGTSRTVLFQYNDATGEISLGIKDAAGKARAFPDGYVSFYIFIRNVDMTKFTAAQQQQLIKYYLSYTTLVSLFGGV